MASLLLILFATGICSCLLSVVPRTIFPTTVEAQTTFFSMLLWLISLVIACSFSQNELITISRPWIHFGGLNVNLGIAIDSIAITMILLITTITALVHLYSWGYLEKNTDRPRFFSLISFFCMMILLLVVSSSLLSLFIGWEGVGVASFLLIGFWREKRSAQQASLQAFIANRIGDWAFLIALLLLAKEYQQWDWAMLTYTKQEIQSLTLFLLAFAAITKSAQLPMSFWLPGSMEGPTPISALIHAATMVTAGIYLLIRFEPLLATEPLLQQALLFISCATIIIMSLRACTHRDIKRVIAYSTIAQLGYMTAAVALLQPDLALGHLWTHGFFKALLFLAAGGVIIISGHQQDLLALAGVLKRERLLLICFIIGLLSLISLPPFPGFYSKELLFAHTNHAHWSIKASLKIGAILTAAYSGRLLGYLWLHPENNSTKALKPLPRTMQVSLVILSLLTLLLAPLSFLSSSFFEFPWIHKSLTTDWLKHASDPLLFLSCMVFIITALTRYPNISVKQTNILDSKPEKFDIFVQTMTHRLFHGVQIAREYCEDIFENIIRDGSTSPIKILSSWIKLLQNMPLRSQIISLFWVLSLTTVLLEGGKNL